MSDRVEYRELFRDGIIRVMVKIVSYSTEQPHLSHEGIAIEVCVKDLLGQSAYVPISTLPHDRLYVLLSDIVTKYALGWDRGECPWIDWTAAGRKP